MEKRKTVFAIDDEEANLKYLKRILEKTYKVVTSDNSEIALPIIRNINPDIILLDVNMPTINGFELCKLLVSNAETKDIPIIFISYLRDPEDLEKGLSLGAVDFIPKPINKIETLARIKTHLTISQLQKELATSNSELKKLVEEKAKRLEVEKSENYKIQDALIESENKFQIVFKSAPEAIIIVSVESGEIIDSNPALCELTGYSHDELIGMNQTKLLQPSKEKMNKNYFQTKTEDSNNLSVKMSLNTLVKKTGEKIPVKNSRRTILIEGELFLFGVIFDLTDILKAEEGLRKSKEKAEELNRLKSFFLQNLSHELRTPLVAMLGFSNILEEEIKDEYLKHLAHTITTSGKRLLNTLTTLVDFSVLESNHQNLKWDKINIGKIINSVVLSFEDSYKERGLEVTINIPKEDIIIDADEAFITEVISQLMSNAVAYTHYGSILITLETEEKGGNRYAIISIKDSGIGISEEQLNSIFDDFRQVSEGCSRDYEGLGLGLALVKKIVDLHKGEITVESKKNEGSIFRLKFKAEKEPLQKLVTT